jgi:3-oxoacyl-[acyl-carrier-protein] synthase-3
MDLNAACSGFLFALSTADQMIRAGGAHRVLVIGAEKLSYYLDFTNRATCVLFGDGAGAVVLEESDEPGGLLAFELGSDGTAGDLLCIVGSGTENNPLRDVLPTIFMEGPEVFRRAVTLMGDASTRVIARCRARTGGCRPLIPHQANGPNHRCHGRRLDLDPKRVFINIAACGNTSAATIPIALSEALEEGRIGAGDVIVFAAFGGGFTWAAAAYRWGSRVTPLGTSNADLPPSSATALELLAPNIELHGRGI